MDKKEKLNVILNNLADELNITTTMREKAETAYTALGNYITVANDNWIISVYPQGSFELGTVVKPLSEDEQYDVDLVVLVKSPTMSADKLRSDIKGFLTNYGRYQGKIEDKKPCIRIQYAESSQFHMDVACAKDASTEDTSIYIARANDEAQYYYDISNPKGYIEWFKKTMNYDELRKMRMLTETQTDVQRLQLSRMRTPLQKAVQLLKRHRDICFADQPHSDERPSSIIITTLCAMAYEETRSTIDKDNVYQTILYALERFPSYIQKNDSGEYYLGNPSNMEENFLSKWKDKPSLVAAFSNWLSKAKSDIISNPERFIEEDPKRFREGLFKSLGHVESEKAMEKYGQQFSDLANQGELYYGRQDGNLTRDKSIGSEYNSHTFFSGSI